MTSCTNQDREGKEAIFELGSSGPADSMISAQADARAVVVYRPDSWLSPVNETCKAMDGAQVVSLFTEDGMKLEAESYLSGIVNSPAVVLLHMSPPDNDRSNFPRSFIQALLLRGISVLNLDRRGAGASEGEPVDAYIGSKGKLDVMAALAFYASHPCPIDLERVVLIGAGTGTTSALDYTIHASTSNSMYPPRALVFLTGGTFTEQQNKLSENRVLLDSLPMLMIYSSEDRLWSEALIGSKSPLWEFIEYEGAGFGTQMLSNRPDAIVEIVTFVHKVSSN